MAENNDSSNASMDASDPVITGRGDSVSLTNRADPAPEGGLRGPARAASKGRASHRRSRWLPGAGQVGEEKEEEVNWVQLLQGAVRRVMGLPPAQPPQANPDPASGGQRAQDDVSWADARSAVIDEVADDLNGRFKNVMEGQATAAFHNRDAILERIGVSSGELLSKDSMIQMMGRSDLPDLRDSVKSLVHDMRQQLASLQTSNDQRLTEVAAIESRLQSPDALEALDHATARVDEQVDRTRSGLEVALQQSQALLGQIEQAQLARAQHQELERTVGPLVAEVDRGAMLPASATEQAKRDAQLMATAHQQTAQHIDHKGPDSVAPLVEEALLSKGWKTIALRGLQDPNYADAFTNEIAAFSRQGNHEAPGQLPMMDHLSQAVLDMEQSTSQAGRQPLDPDHPDHPDYPQRQAAQQRIALASMVIPKGPGEGPGSIEQIVKSLDDISDLPMPSDSLGR